MRGSQLGVLIVALHLFMLPLGLLFLYEQRSFAAAITLITVVTRLLACFERRVWK